MEGLPEGLTPAEEEAAVKAGDRDKLVLHGLREAFLYGKACYSKLESGEVLSSCYDGLKAAAKSFETGQIRFFGHAKPYVRGALYRAWKTRETVVKKGAHEPLPEPQVDGTGPEADPNYLPLYKEQQTEPHTLPDFDAIQMHDEWARVLPTVQKMLTSHQRMIFELHYRGGLNFREIGSLLKLGRAAIQYSHRTALKKIRIELMRRKSYSR